MKHYFRVIDYIQWIWKSVWNIEKSRSQICRDLKQGAVKLNDRKLKVDDIIEIDDGKNQKSL